MNKSDIYFLHGMAEKLRRYHELLEIPTIFKRRYIYFIEADENIVKIGSSRNIKKRMSNLQTTSPAPLTLVAALEYYHLASFTFERTLHVCYRHRRVSGEWFKIDNDFAGAIDRAVQWYLANFSSAVTHPCPHIYTVRCEGGFQTYIEEYLRRGIDDY